MTKLVISLVLTAVLFLGIGQGISRGDELPTVVRKEWLNPANASVEAQRGGERIETRKVKK